MGKFINITKQKFGKLTAIKFDHVSLSKKQYWLFECDCGNRKVIARGGVTEGRIKSCGCSQYLVIHGMTKTRFWGIWQGFKQRCLNRKNKCYYRYGGRDIKVSDRWLKFENFYNDMYGLYLEHVKKFGERNTSLDRIDNNGNYELQNCKWATMKEQQNNKRNSKSAKNTMINYNGKIQSFEKWQNELLKYVV